LYKLIDGERLSTSNKTDTSLVVYFKTRLLCDLDKNHSFKGNYKSNALIKMLENNNLGERLIDSTKIEELDGIKIFFENNIDYSLEKYNSEKVIGTIDISRISFNKSMTIGYFYYIVYCGEDCGWGDLIKIEKNNGRWIIIKYLISWVS
jgi:hypothetical protein